MNIIFIGMTIGLVWGLTLHLVFIFGKSKGYQKGWSSCMHFLIKHEKLK